MIAVPAVAGAVLVALLALRTALLLWRFGRERRATAQEVERRRALGLAPVPTRLESDQELVVLGTFWGDDGLRWDPVRVETGDLHLRAASGERFVIPAGGELLAIGVPSAVQRGGRPRGAEVRTELVIPRATPLWVLAPQAAGDGEPYRGSATPVRLVTDLEVSEQRAFLELAPAPRHRPRWSVWGGMLVVVAVPSLPWLPPLLTVTCGILLIGLAFIALMTCAFVEAGEISEPFGRWLLVPRDPWPARHSASPSNRGVSP